MLKAAEWCRRGSELACQCFCRVKSSDARCAASQAGFCLLAFIVCFCECLASNNKCPKNLEHVRTDEGLRKGKLFSVFIVAILSPPWPKLDWNIFNSQLRPLVIFTCTLRCSSHLNSMKYNNSLIVIGLFPFSMILVEFNTFFHSSH